MINSRDHATTSFFGRIVAPIFWAFSASNSRANYFDSVYATLEGTRFFDATITATASLFSSRDYSQKTLYMMSFCDYFCIF